MTPRLEWLAASLALTFLACGSGAEAPYPVHMPQAPRVPILTTRTVVPFTPAREGDAVLWAVSDDTREPALFQRGTSVVFDTPGTRTLWLKEEAETDTFSFTYDVRAQLPGPAEAADSTAVAKDDPRLHAWATAIAAVHYGANVEAGWRHPERALGPATGVATDVLPLGEGGSVTLRFDPPITDGAGPDFAVFENGFSDTFLEYAYVEVASAAGVFVRFDSLFLGETPLGSFGTSEAGWSYGLAGRYRAGYGTPFDLADLQNHPAVLAGALDLRDIRYVRLVDVIGDGSDTDSFGHPIYDPTPTTGSAGFDLDAVGVLNP